MNRRDKAQRRRDRRSAKKRNAQVAGESELLARDMLAKGIMTRVEFAFASAQGFDVDALAQPMHRARLVIETIEGQPCPVCAGKLALVECRDVHGDDAAAVEGPHIHPECTDCGTLTVVVLRDSESRMREGLQWLRRADN
jgi:hypothetical protein